MSRWLAPTGADAPHLLATRTLGWSAQVLRGSFDAVREACKLHDCMFAELRQSLRTTTYRVTPTEMAFNYVQVQNHEVGH